MGDILVRPVAHVYDRTGDILREADFLLGIPPQDQRVEIRRDGPDVPFQILRVRMEENDAGGDSHCFRIGGP